jgi:2-C-methyl-D-erythritol 4-phosphate cytidylyltransferase
VSSPRDVGAVIVAAGRGARLGGSLPKQYLPIAGVPMLLRSLRPFVSHPEVRQVVLVLPEAEAAAPPAWLAPHLGECLRLVAGGAERGDSVAAGLAALDAACGVVLVHDAARPFVTRDVLDAVIGAARDGVGAVPAVPVADTLKAEGAPGVVARTVPREGLWRAQTPQGFPRAMLEEAHARARADGVRGTDDAALVERIGGVVRLVPGDPRNLKVTTPDDLALAEVLAERVR